MVAVAFSEKLAGALGFGSGGGQHPLSLTVRARARTFRQLLAAQLDIAGWVQAPGFADQRPLAGSIRLQPPRTLRYRFAFRDNHDKLHRFDGERRISLGGLPVAVTVLQGRLDDAEGSTVAWAILRFDVRADLPDLIRSLSIER